MVWSIHFFLVFVSLAHFSRYGVDDVVDQKRLKLKLMS